MTPFAELARTIATNWKTVDDDTKEYCQTVARIIRERHSVLGRSKGFYVPKKKTKNSAKNTRDGHTGPRMEHNMPQRRLSMPGNLVLKNNLVGEKGCNRSMSLGDRSPSSIGSCVPYMDHIGLPVPAVALCPVTPDFAISSYRDIASRILQMNNQGSNSSNNAVTQEQRRSSLPNISSRPSPPSISVVGSSIQEPAKVNQDIMGIIDAPPSSENKIIQEKNRRSSLPNLQTSASFFHYPSSAGEFHFPIVCPTISDCSKGTRSNKVVVHEVDISDSAIHDMWSSDES